jgi:aspartate 1-decarboxylase
VNGAAAHKADPGDRIIICAYGELDQAEAKAFKPRLIYLNDENRIKRTAHMIPVQAA